MTLMFKFEKAQVQSLMIIDRKRVKINRLAENIIESDLSVLKFTLHYASSFSKFSNPF